MSALEGIAQFGTGAIQGFGTGMDLYERYAQGKEKSDARKQKKAIEEKTIDLMKSGQYKDDPVGFSKEIANFHLDAGDTDGWQQWDQYHRQVRNAYIEELGKPLFAAAQSKNPEAAVPYLNKMYKAYGNDQSVDIQRTPSGARMVRTVGGKPMATDYSNEDMDRLSHDILAEAEGYVFSPKDYAETQREGMKATAYASNLQNEQDIRNAKLPGELGQTAAQTQSALAAAGNYSAQSRRADAAFPLQQQALQSEIDQRQATATHQQNEDARAAEMFPIDKATKEKAGAYQDALTQNALQGQPPTRQSSEQIIHEGAPKPDPMADVQDPRSDELFLGGIANDLKKADPTMDDKTAAYNAAELAGLSADEIKNLDTQEAVRTGQLKLPNGKIIPYSGSLAMSLMSVARRKSAVAP
jgi:hypothetical protein